MSFKIDAQTKQQTTVIIAAHGSPVDPIVNQTIKATAERIQASGCWPAVLTAFHYGTPDFENVLHEVKTTNVVVVPLLTSDGYFTEVVKNAFAAAATKLPHLQIAISQTIGTHAEAPLVSARRLNQQISQQQWAIEETAVLIVGHGTRRHAKSRSATNVLADAIGRLMESLPEKPLVAFIDDDPTISEVLTAITQQNLIVFPFLIANGPHARVDIPAELESHRQGKTIFIEQPFGMLSGVDDLILARADEGLSILRAQEADLNESSLNVPAGGKS